MKSRLCGYNTRMQAFFADMEIQRRPPTEMRLVMLTAAAYPDGKRIRVQVEFTPFEKSPVLEITIRDGQGLAVGSTTIIEPFTWRQELTMHLRDTVFSPGEHQIEAVLLYPDLGEIDRRDSHVT